MPFIRGSFERLIECAPSVDGSGCIYFRLSSSDHAASSQHFYSIETNHHGIAEVYSICVPFVFIFKPSFFIRVVDHCSITRISVSIAASFLQFF